MSVHRSYRDVSRIGLVKFDHLAECDESGVDPCGMAAGQKGADMKV